MILSLKEEKGRIRKSDYLKYPTVPRPQFVIQWHLRGKGIDDLTEEEKKALEKAHFKQIIDPKGKVRSAIEKTAGCSNHQDFRIQLTDRTLIGYTIVGLRWGIVGKDITKDDLGIHAETTKKRGFRAELKATQPCIAGDTWVLTADGFKQVKDLQVGDLLIDHEGKFTKITRITRNIWKPCCKIKILGAPEFICDWEHPILVNQAVPPVDLAKLSSDQRKKILNKFDAKFMLPLAIQERQFALLPRVQLPNGSKYRGYQLGYILGRFIGDGSRSLEGKPRQRVWRICCNAKRTDYLKVLQLVKSLFNSGWINKEGSVVEVRFRVNRLGLNWLFEQCYRDNEKIFPRELLFESNFDFKLGLLHGLIESDGYSTSTHCYFCSSSPQIAGMFYLLALSLGLKPQLRVKKNNAYNDYSKKQGLYFEIKFYVGEKQTIREWGNYLGYRIKEIKNTEEVELWNIETETQTYCLPSCAVHNSVWMNVKGYVPKGKVGATAHHGGFFIIMAKGDVVFGALKPYFKEYFVKDPYCFKDWTRIIVRGVKAQKLDPEKKTPLKGQYELIWRIMIPETQKPYAITERAKRKGWFPPKGVIPFPLEWAKKHWKEDVEKWLEWVQEKWKEKPKGQMKLSKKIKWALFMHTWMGQVVIRGIPNYEFYLRIDDGKQKILSFVFEKNPLRYTSITGVYEGRVAKKWLTFEGDLPPKSPYNPTKKLTVHVIKLDGGDGEIDIDETEEGAKILKLKLNGKILNGNFLLVQEEKGSDIFVFKRERRLAKGYFKLYNCLLYTSPSPRDRTRSRMPSSA